MPLYEYRSESGETIEIFLSMKDEKPESIQKNGETYKRVFSVPMMTIVDSKKPKTIGALAEANTKRMLSEGKIKPKEKYIPWWRKKAKVDTSLTKLSKKQRERYIRTGKK